MDTGSFMASHAIDGLLKLTAREQSELFRRRKASPVDFANSTLAQIERCNPVLNAYCHLDPERVLLDARESEARWSDGVPLSDFDGVLFGVKDLLAVRGVPTGSGSKAAWTGIPSAHDAPAVARLREAGCVLVGKTTTSEFGWKGTTDSPLTGQTVNPWNTALTTGGSSGGAAAAAMAGMGVFQLGTDGGGSARIPASFCGVAGMKATFGRVPAWPAGPMLTLSNVGPIAKTTGDLKALYRIISQPDGRDWNAVPRPYAVHAPVGSLKGLRFGLHIDESLCDADVSRAMRKFSEVLKSSGAEVIDTALPLQDARALVETHWEAGTAWLVSQVPEERRGLIDPGLREVAARGDRLSLPAYYKAIVGRQKFGEAMLQHFAPFDFVLTPTIPILPFAAGRECPEGTEASGWLGWNPYTYPFNLTRQPAVSIPVGSSTTGLPIGLQIVGKLYDDERLLQVAELMEAMLCPSSSHLQN